MFFIHYIADVSALSYVSGKRTSQCITLNPHRSAVGLVLRENERLGITETMVMKD